MRLTEKTRAIREKEYILDPSRAEQNVNCRNGDSGLAGSRCHNYEATSAIAAKGTTNSPNCIFLVVAIGDVVANDRIGNIFSTGDALLEEVKLFERMKSKYAAHRKAKAIDAIDVIAGDIVGRGQIAIMHLKDFRSVLCRCSPLNGVASGMGKSITARGLPSLP